MAISKIPAAAISSPAKKAVNYEKRALKQFSQLVQQLAQSMDISSDGGLNISADEVNKLRKNFAKAKNLKPEQRAQIEHALAEADVALKTNEVVAKVRAALDGDGEGGRPLTREAALGIINDAKGLPQEVQGELKTQVLGALIQRDHWDSTPDARAAFADFLGVPADRLPAPSKPQVKASVAFTKTRNEAGPRAISRAEFKNIASHLQDLPQHLRETTLTSLLGAHQDGRIKLDPESRKLLTRSVATSFVEGTEQSKAWRDNSSLMASGNYVAQIIAGGGSFEDVLFAFLLMMADKADKDAQNAMEELANMEKGGQPHKVPKTGLGDPGALSGATNSGKPAAPVTTPGAAAATTTNSLAGLSDAEVADTAKIMESMVQSADHAGSAKSDGGVQVTQKEATRLVGYLQRLPEGVQTLLAGSIEKAIQAGGVPLSGNAHIALAAWGEQTLGRPFDIAVSGNGREAVPANTELAKALRDSDKLEDRFASFIVDTLYKPEISLKDKMKPFKSLRTAMGEAAQQIKQTPAAQPINGVDAPAATGAAELAADAKAMGKGEAHSAADDFVLRPPNSVFGSSMVPEVNFGGDEGGQAGPQAGGGSKIQAQHKLQMAMNNRQRVLDMLSNIMKAIHDTQMTAVRNLR